MGPICFVAGNEKFLFRHFSPAIAAATATGAEVVALVPGDRAEGRVIDGVRLLPIPIVRSANTLPSLLAEALWLRNELRKLSPSVVVAYSMRMCVLAALAQFFVRSPGFVFVVTGLGALAFADTLKARVMRSAVFALLRRVSRSRSHFLFENRSDPQTTGIAQRGHRLSIVMGAGIELSEFSAQQDEPGGVIRFATVSRLIWSKGIDLAADAISSLAREGHPVELHIYGEPDLANPNPVKIEGFVGLPGVHYHGYTDRIADVWKENQVAIFASRAGEGLPRALLEAAAASRPSIVTAVPGCVDFVRNGVEGLVANEVSAASIRRAVADLLSAPEKMTGMGRRAQERVRATSTSEMITTEYQSIFRSLLQDERNKLDVVVPPVSVDRALKVML